MAFSQILFRQSLPYILVALLCASIVATQECSQIALKTFKYPFILRYINSIEQISLFLIIPIWRWYKLHQIQNRRKGKYNNSAINYKRSKTSKKRINIIKPDIHIDDKHFRWFIFYALWGSITVTSAGMVLNLGLAHITVPTATALSSFRTVFTLALSTAFLSYPLKLWSIAAVIVSILGISLYVMEIDGNVTNDGDHHDTLYGISCCLTAQLFFAINDIICKKAANYCYDTNRIVMGNILYTIYTSLFSLPLFIWVIWYPQNIADNISFTPQTLFWILITGVCLLGIHVTAYVTISIKSPTWTVMATLLATPMAFFLDIILHDYKPSYLCVLGTMLLVLGFLMLEIVRPSQILCPFCDIALINHRDALEDWDYEEGSMEFENKRKLSDSLEDAYGYKYKKDNLSGVVDNKHNTVSNTKYNSGMDSDDVEPMLSALLQSGGTYASASTIPSDIDKHYTTEEIADISFDVNGNDNLSD